MGHVHSLSHIKPPKPPRMLCRVGLFVGCLTSQQHASVSQGRICSDNFTCCHTEIEVADQNVYLTQSQYTDTGPTSPSADPITPGAWQGSHWSANFEVTGMTRQRKKPVASGIGTRDLPLSRRTRLPQGQRGGLLCSGNDTSSFKCNTVHVGFVIHYQSHLYQHLHDT